MLRTPKHKTCLRKAQAMPITPLAIYRSGILLHVPVPVNLLELDIDARPTKRCPYSDKSDPMFLSTTLHTYLENNSVAQMTVSVLPSATSQSIVKVVIIGTYDLYDYDRRNEIDKDGLARAGEGS